MSKDEKDNGKEFTFIKEQILPKKKSRLKKVCVSLGATVVLAFVFGIIARAAFILSGPWINRILGIEQEKKQITLTTSENGQNGVMAGSPVGKEVQDEEGLQEQAEESKVEKITPESEKKGKEKEKEKEKEEKKTVNNTYYVQSKVKADVEDFASMYSSLRRIASQASGSIVTIVCAQENVDVLENLYETKTEVPGVVVAKDDKQVLILTTYEKAVGASYLKAMFAGNVTVEASLAGADEEAGLAILSVEKKALSQYADNDSKVAKLGESYLLSPGTPILAVGSPNGVSGSFDFGMVTNTKGTKSITDMSIDLFYTNNVMAQNGQGFIINLDGDVVGIITNHAGSQNKDVVCTAIGISSVKKLIEKLINGEERAYLGVVAKDMPADALADAGVNYGIYVKEVEAKSPAYDAGLQNGDIIVYINDSSVLGMNSFASLKDALSYKEEVTIGIIRYVNGKPKSMELPLEVGKVK